MARGLTTRCTCWVDLKDRGGPAEVLSRLHAHCCCGPALLGMQQNILPHVNLDKVAALSGVSSLSRLYVAIRPIT